MSCTIFFCTSGPAHTIIGNGQCTVVEGAPTAYDLKITISDDNLVALLTGKMNPATGLLLGKFKIEGDKSIGIKLKTLFDRDKLK